MALRVLQYGERGLREEAEPVAVFDDELSCLLDQMLESLHASRGIGLAAQHLGIRKCICVIDFVDAGEDAVVVLDGKELSLAAIMPLFIVNPELSLLGKEVVVAEEGSISFPGISGPVKRSQAVRLSYQDSQGMRHVLECRGWLSRCIQHEVDHLNGILFIERIEPRVLMGLQSKLKKLKREGKKR